MAVLFGVEQDSELQLEEYINISRIVFRRLTKGSGKKGRFSTSS